MSGRWKLVPFGDTVSQTNVLSFARLNVVPAQILGGQLRPLTPIPYTYGTSTGVRGRDLGIEEGTGKEIGGRRTVNAKMDVQSFKATRDKK